MLKTLTAAGLLVGLGMASSAPAADNAMQVCGAKYQAAKTAKTLAAGQTWPQFLAQCRGTMTKAAPKIAAASPAPSAKAPMSVPARMTKAPHAAGQPSAAQIASRTRLTQCSKNYQADKAANRLAGQTWPKYYSACNTRLKG